MRLRRSADVVSLSWGLIDQSFSSATNFGLTVIAGRSAGPAGLGAVFVGFSAYLVLLTMLRALVTDPMIVASASYSVEDRAAVARKALTLIIGASAMASLLLLVLGLLLPASVGDGLLFFIPWLVGALVQDFWRATLFRSGRGAAAALNDGVWAVAMVLAIPLLLVDRSGWIVVLTWGVGGLAGGLLGFLQTGLRPAGVRASACWWTADVWPMARWLGPEAGLLVVNVQIVVFALVAIVGTANVGGLRAVQAVFAPMSLLAQAISFPGLPMLATMAVTSPRRARVWALRLSALGVGLVVAYLAVLSVLPRHLIGVVFGPAFDQFDGVIAPVGVAQLVGAAFVGISLLVKAEGRMGSLLLSRVISTVPTVVLTVILAQAGGIVAAAWGLTLGAAIGLISIAVLAFRRRA